MALGRLPVRSAHHSRQSLSGKPLRIPAAVGESAQFCRVRTLGRLITLGYLRRGGLVMRSVFSIVSAVCLLAVSAVHATDLEKETRWAEQVVDSLLDGEAVYLNDGRADFLAIETASTDAALRRAVVVMHGTGFIRIGRPWCSPCAWA
ncbi:MAG: hypothetical protein H6962_13570 [Chromatiaceae bacterium]|nr:hypothetical protein [Chromatiaceae bacterium]